MGPHLSKRTSRTEKRRRDGDLPKIRGLLLRFDSSLLQHYRFTTSNEPKKNRDGFRTQQSRQARGGLAFIPSIGLSSHIFRNPMQVRALMAHEPYYLSASSKILLVCSRPLVKSRVEVRVPAIFSLFLDMQVKYVTLGPIREPPLRT